MAKKKNIAVYLGAAALVYFLYKRMKNTSSGNTGGSASENSQSGGTAYNEEKSNNLRLLNEAMKNAGINNRYARTAIMAVVGKESNFIPKYENCYNNTSNFRIRKIFPSRLGDYSDAQLNTLKADCVDFFNAVYGGKYDTPSNLGYQYRGSGYNQLTFLSNYKKIGNLIGVDLVDSPDLNNRSDVAAKSVVAYMLDRANSTVGKQKLQSGGFATVNDINNIEFAVRYFANANAGFGYSFTGDKVNEAVNRSNPYLPNVFLYSA